MYYIEGERDKKRKAADVELMLLKKPSKVEDLAARVPKPRDALPTNPLPSWTEYSLDQKVPAIPAPFGEFKLSRNNIGEKVYLDVPNQPFDNADPYIHETPKEYEPLHDPHLREFFQLHPKIVEHLLDIDLLTIEGAVNCSLADLNKYRQYLSRVHKNFINAEREREERWEKFERDQLDKIKAWFIGKAKQLREEERRLKRMKARAENDRMLQFVRRKHREHPSNLIKELRSRENASRKSKRDLKAKLVAGRVAKMRAADRKRIQKLVLKWLCEEQYAERLRAYNVATDWEERQINLQDFVNKKREIQENKMRFHKALLSRDKTERGCKIQRRQDYYDRREKEVLEEVVEREDKQRRKEARIIYLMEKYGRRWLALTRRSHHDGMHESIWHIRKLLQDSGKYLKDLSGARSFTSFLAAILKPKKKKDIWEGVDPETKSVVKELIKDIVGNAYNEIVRQATTCLVDFVVDEARKKCITHICEEELDPRDLEQPLTPTRRKIILPRTPPLWPCGGPCAQFGERKGGPDWRERCDKMAEALGNLHDELTEHLSQKFNEDMDNMFNEGIGLGQMKANVDYAKQTPEMDEAARTVAGIALDRASSEPADEEMQENFREHATDRLHASMSAGRKQMKDQLQRQRELDAQYALAQEMVDAEMGGQLDKARARQAELIKMLGLEGAAEEGEEEDGISALIAKVLEDQRQTLDKEKRGVRMMDENELEGIMDVDEDNLERVGSGIVAEAICDTAATSEEEGEEEEELKRVVLEVLDNVAKGKEEECIGVECSDGQTAGLSKEGSSKEKGKDGEVKVKGGKLEKSAVSIKKKPSIGQKSRTSGVGQETKAGKVDKGKSVASVKKKPSVSQDGKRKSAVSQEVKAGKSEKPLTSSQKTPADSKDGKTSAEAQKSEPGDEAKQKGKGKSKASLEGKSGEGQAGEEMQRGSGQEGHGVGLESEPRTLEELVPTLEEEQPSQVSPAQVPKEESKKGLLTESELASGVKGASGASEVLDGKNRIPSKADQKEGQATTQGLEQPSGQKGLSDLSGGEGLIEGQEKEPELSNRTSEELTPALEEQPSKVPEEESKKGLEAHNLAPKESTLLPPPTKSAVDKMTNQFAESEMTSGVNALKNVEAGSEAHDGKTHIPSKTDQRESGEGQTKGQGLEQPSASAQKGLSDLSEGKGLNEGQEREPELSNRTSVELVPAMEEQTSQVAEEGSKKGLESLETSGQKGLSDLSEGKGRTEGQEKEPKLSNRTSEELIPALEGQHAESEMASAGKSVSATSAVHDGKTPTPSSSDGKKGGEDQIPADLRGEDLASVLKRLSYTSAGKGLIEGQTEPQLSNRTSKELVPALEEQPSQVPEKESRTGLESLEPSGVDVLLEAHNLPPDESTLLPPPTQSAVDKMTNQITESEMTVGVNALKNVGAMSEVHDGRTRFPSRTDQVEGQTTAQGLEEALASAQKRLSDLSERRGLTEGQENEPGISDLIPAREQPSQIPPGQIPATEEPSGVLVLLEAHNLPPEESNLQLSPTQSAVERMANQLGESEMTSRLNMLKGVPAASEVHDGRTRFQSRVDQKEGQTTAQGLEEALFSAQKRLSDLSERKGLTEGQESDPMLSNRISELIRCVIDEQRGEVQRETDIIVKSDDEGDNIEDILNEDNLSRVASAMAIQSICAKYDAQKRLQTRLCGDTAPEPTESLLELVREYISSQPDLVLKGWTKTKCSATTAGKEPHQHFHGKKTRFSSDVEVLHFPRKSEAGSEVPSLTPSQYRTGGQEQEAGPSSGGTTPKENEQVSGESLYNVPSSAAQSGMKFVVTPQLMPEPSGWIKPVTPSTIKGMTYGVQESSRSFADSLYHPLTSADAKSEVHEGRTVFPSTISVFPQRPESSVLLVRDAGVRPVDTIPEIQVEPPSTMSIRLEGPESSALLDAGNVVSSQDYKSQTQSRPSWMLNPDDVNQIIQLQENQTLPTEVRLNVREHLREIRKTLDEIKRSLQDDIPPGNPPPST